MKHINRFTSAALFLVISVAATPALAQRHSPRDRGAEGNSGGGDRADNRGGGNGGQRQDNRATERRAPQPQSEARAPRVETQQRAQAPRNAAPPEEQRVQPRGQAIPRAAPRFDNRGRVENRGGFDNRGFDRGRIVTGRPYYGYSRPYYSRPYYSFRPRFSLGFGLWLGYPVTYPYDVYGYPYPSTYPYPDASYPYSSGSVNVAPRTNPASGGLSFEISPATAEVYVDGEYAGVVSDFTPNMPPLGLTPGRHRIEVRENGFETMAFDANIVAGQVLPFQGTMQRF